MSELTDRLRELSRAAAAGNHREFYMSIPAQPKRDADLVLDEAAKLIESYESRLETCEAERAQCCRYTEGYAEATIKLLEAERDRYREALECLLPGLTLDLRYASDDDDIDALRSRVKTVTDALTTSADRALEALSDG